MADIRRKLHIAVAGNPNVGKTTLLNALTGSKQRVGNWPGVTVEKLEGTYVHQGTEVLVTDLPGIYSFTAFSIDESIARKFILESKPDLIVNIVDATNLERNLFLTTQLLEMKVPMVVALNMMDLAERRRLRIEVDHLERHLGCPVIPLNASKLKGVEELRELIHRAGSEKPVSPTRVAYDTVLEKEVEPVSAAVIQTAGEKGVDPRWLALRLLEGDAYARELCGDNLPEKLLDEAVSRIEKHVGDEIDIVLADGRYGFIHGLARDVINRTDEVRKTVSDGIDRIMLNRFLGIPVFLAVMYIVFAGTITFSKPFVDFFEILTGTIFVEGFSALLSSLGSPAMLTAFLAEGVGGGIQTVATFIPPIFLIFLFLSLLEDSGYMARAAFVMDRFLRAIGLPGKAFIPMLVGFGCNVPAIMATRTLENNRDRILAIMMNPFMSCGARLPVYALFVAVFFPDRGGPVLFSIYVTGILLAVLTGLLFKRTILRGETSTFVMELPPYHVPTFRGIMYHTLSRLKGFVLRAGRVIVMVVVVLSLLGSIGTDGTFGNGDSENSVLSLVGKKVTPVFSPMGITGENWPAAVGLFSGIFAKEAVVGTLDNLYSGMAGSPETGTESFSFSEGIENALSSVPDGFREITSPSRDQSGWDGEDFSEESGFSSVEIMRSRFDGRTGAYAYLLFILIYSPCIAAIAAIYRETSLSWALFSTSYLTVLAWVFATLFYRFATIRANPGESLLWIGVSAAILAAVYLGIKKLGASGKLRA